MATRTIEARLATVESELLEIKRRLAAEKSPEPIANWEKMFGIFADSEGFEEATRLGQEYRKCCNAILFVVFAALAILVCPFGAFADVPLTFSGETLFGISQPHPFRDAYPYMLGNIPQTHALLSISQTHVRQVGLGIDPSGELFTMDIRLYNDSGDTRSFYNLYWNPLIPEPGHLALYDAQKQYVCDLLDSTGGSRATLGGWAWAEVPALGYVGIIKSVSLPYPSYKTLSPGMYYLQVIYQPRFAQPLSKSNDKSFDYSDNAELFRSNVVVLTVEQPRAKPVKHQQTL